MENSGADPWSQHSIVAGFATGAPNQTLMEFAHAELARAPGCRALDIGCGAGRNAVPLAAMGWRVVGVDRSHPMLAAAGERARNEGIGDGLRVARAAMDRLPIADRSCHLLIAHGIWNLAHSSGEFRRAVREAARVATPNAALFVFTFSRSTFDANAEPVAGEPFVFTQFSNTPYCFLTSEQLVNELAAAGFTADATAPLRELNRRIPGMLAASGAPVIWEGIFRYRPTR